MAINKTINKSTKSHGAMRNCIQYVLQEQKISDGLVYMTGPAPDEITWDSVYQSFLEEKEIWNKDSGRMYIHNVISFHKDENITPEQALNFGKDFAEAWFSGFQTLIAVHQDKDHIHLHEVTNTVSYEDGHKHHNSREDLQHMKDFTNEMCREYGLTVAEKGRHFDGSNIEEGETIAWSKDKYHLLNDEKKKSFVVDCAIAVLESKESCTGKDEFIKNMENKGWHTTWADHHKHITFSNDNGDKVRDTNLSKSFSMDISKEALQHEFERQNELVHGQDRTNDEDLRRYYAEIEAATAGIDPTDAVGNDTEAIRRDTDAFLRELDSQERASGEKRDHSISERQNRDVERRRLSIAREQALKEEQRRTEIERTESHRRSARHSLSL